MLGIAHGESLDMLHPEKVMPEIGFAPRNGDRPGKDNHKAAQDRQPAVKQKVLPAFLDNDPRQHAHHRYGQGEEAFS